MTVKQIVEILELDKLAPIHYHTPCIGDEVFYGKYYDKNKYPNITFNETFGRWLPDINPDETFGVYLPDTSVDEACSLMFKFNKEAFKAFEYELNLKFNHDDNNLIFIIFFIHHEIGHWVDFDKKDLMEKCKWIEHVANNTQVLNLKRITRRSISPEIPEEFNALADSFDYMNMPHEKAANEYAKAHYLDSYGRIKKYLKQCESNKYKSRLLDSKRYIIK